MAGVDHALLSLSKTVSLWHGCLMLFKIEMRYFYGWDDAEWTEEIEGQEKPLRFQSVHDAEAEIVEFLASVETAVAAGDMIAGHSRDEYRIVEVNE